MSLPVGRLKQRADFLRIAAGRRRWAAPGLVLQVRRCDSSENAEREEPVRVGFTVSRKVGGAVERNRVRRRLRAVAREVLPARARPGTDYVIIGRRQALDRAFPELIADLETAMRKLDAIDGAGRGDRP